MEIEIRPWELQKTEEKDRYVLPMVRLKESGELDFPITNDNIKAVIFDMFSAGTESSSSTLDWTMAELMKHPRVMRTPNIKKIRKKPCEIKVFLEFQVKILIACVQYHL
ncbi:unnamed protein product [Fraxinus pennsylvanica]|uniref:Cytochrome P450 n=1 Tax=Fraxinus pennsylvanica TaxID=56036 RepID=A0AAD2E1W5_9LAMI|nr:unnamed protein product [Fraxinus pennsylvanica]